MNTLIKRNLTLYFRNKQAVFFSFFAGLIIIGLYILIGNFAELEESFPNAEPEQLSALMYSFVFSGSLLAVCFTSAGGLLNIVVRDRESGVASDFLVSSIKRSQIGLGYLLSAYIVSVLMTMLSAVICFAYLIIACSYTLTLSAVLLTFGTILLYGALGASFSTLIVTAIVKSDGAYTGFTAIISAGIGFFAGIYIPLSQLNANISAALQFLPFAQGASLFHQAMMPPAMEVLADKGTLGYEMLSQEFGLDIVINGEVISVPILIAISFAWIAIFVAFIMRNARNKLNQR